jgi:O-antigen/teichoic acid export membrane protein
MFACIIIGIFWIRSSQHLLPTNTSQDRIGASFRSQVIPFAMAVWTTNALANLFPLVDRYMIVTFGGHDPETALSIVGLYHVARLIAVFMVSLAQVLQATLLPYLSHDWESGERTQVSQRLDSFLRLFGFAFYTTAALFLAFGPWLVSLLVGDKFEMGLGVLSLTLTCGVFASLFILAQSYLWCLQKGWLVNAGLAIALILGVGLNLLLLPRFGLSGAAMASCGGTIFMLVYVLLCSRMSGMQFRLSTGLVVLLPVTLLLGPVLAIITLCVAVVVAATSNVLLTEADKRHAVELVQRFRDRLHKKSHGLTMDE